MHTMKKTTKRNTGCPITLALDIFGDKWTLLILRDMMFQNRHRFGELLKIPEGISTNILADRLKRLEQSGIISSHSDPDNYRSTLYELTESGIDLLPIILDIMCWGADYLDGVQQYQEVAARVRTDRASIIQEQRQQMMSRITTAS